MDSAMCLLCTSRYGALTVCCSSITSCACQPGCMRELLCLHAAAPCWLWLCRCQANVALSSQALLTGLDVVEGCKAFLQIPLSSACRLLQVSAVTDDAKIECELSPIAFRPTVMFQTRGFTFPLKNTSMARLNFKWAVLMSDGQPDPTSLYQARHRHKHAACRQCRPSLPCAMPAAVIDPAFCWLLP